EIRSALEELNVGRLRIASKGINHHPRYGLDPLAPKFTALTENEQRIHGMYMIGQVAVLRDSICTIEELHHEVSGKGSELLANLAEPGLPRTSQHEEKQPCNVAVIGMACLFPKAPNLQTYWKNILGKVDAISEIPENRWNWRQYFDPNPKVP